jgi:hypothetical protein
MKWWNDRMAEKPVGWAQFSATNVQVTDGEAMPIPQGILLSAELYVASTGESHHLRHDGATWIATKLALNPNPAESDVLETCAFVHADPHPDDGAKRRQLVYQVAWTGSPLRPTAFRLVAIQNP